MPNDTHTLVHILVQYLDEAGELISQLSAATTNDAAASDVTMRLANCLGRFQIQGGEFLPDYETELDVSH